MDYEISTTKVALGAMSVSVGYYFATDPLNPNVFLLGVLLFVIGIPLTIHGLFTGIEAAVAAGKERTVHDRSAE